MRCWHRRLSPFYRQGRRGGPSVPGRLSFPGDGSSCVPPGCPRVTGTCPPRRLRAPFTCPPPQDREKLCWASWPLGPPPPSHQSRRFEKKACGGFLAPLAEPTFALETSTPPATWSALRCLQMDVLVEDVFPEFSTPKKHSYKNFYTGVVLYETGHLKRAGLSHPDVGHLRAF